MVIDGTLNNVAGGAGATITATQYGIDVVNFSAGNILASTSPGDSINAGSDGIIINNDADGDSTVCRKRHHSQRVWHYQHRLNFGEWF